MRYNRRHVLESLAVLGTTGLISSRANSTGVPSSELYQRSSTTPPPVRWDISAGESGKHNFIYSFAQCSDGGFVLGGISAPLNLESEDESMPWMVKISQSGNKDWSTKFTEYSWPSNESNMRRSIKSIIEMEEGLYLAGVAPGLNEQGALLLINDSGEVQKKREMSNVSTIDKLGSEWIISAGRGSYLPNTSAAIEYIKPNLQIENRVEFSEQKVIRNITSITDNRYIAVGSEEVSTQSEEQNWHAWVGVISEGAKSWETTFSLDFGVETRLLRCSGAIQADNGVIVCGEGTTLDSGPSRSGFTAKVTESGVEWYNIHDPTINEGPRSRSDNFALYDVTRISSNILVTTGEYTREQDASPEKVARVLAINNQGQVIWDFHDTLSNGESESAGRELMNTDDGGIVIGGEHIVEGSVDAHVFKIGGEEQFRPVQDGFGFTNYSTGTTPDFEELLNVVNSKYTPELENIGIGTSPPGFDVAVATALYFALDGGLTSGHCLGMVHTSQKYYNSGVPSLSAYESENSADVTTASDIKHNPEESPNLDPVETDIDEIQHTQALQLRFALRYIAQVFAPPEGPGSIKHSEVLTAIENRITNGETASISIVGSSGNLIDRFLGGHQVLAYDFQSDNNSIENSLNVRVSVYDPNYSAEYYGDSTKYLNFSRTTTDEDFTIQYTGRDSDNYNKAIYLDEAPASGLDFFADSDTVDGYKTALSGGFSGFISVGVKSPITVSVTAPDGTQVSQVEVPTEQLEQAIEYEEIYAGFGAEPGEYEIEVTGTDSGEYTIDLKASHEEGGTIDDSYTGTISEGSTHLFSATLPESADQSGSISLVEEQTPQNTSSEDDSGTLVPLAVGSSVVGGLGIGGYLYKRSKSANEENSK